MHRLCTVNNVHTHILTHMHVHTHAYITHTHALRLMNALLHKRKLMQELVVMATLQTRHMVLKLQPVERDHSRGERNPKRWM